MLINSLEISCFLEVVKRLNFTKAAEILNISQPAVSRHVAALEKELGVQLVFRTKRETRLTQAGREFAEFFSTYDMGLQALKQKYAKQLSGRIQIGIFHGWNIMDKLQAALAKARETTQEKLQLLCNSGDAATLLSGLEAERFDFVICLRDMLPAGEKWAWQLLQPVRRTIVYGRENPLYGRENLTLADFEKQLYYAFRDGRQPRGMIMNRSLFARYGLSPEPVVLDNLDSVLMALHMGDGYALLDELQSPMGNTGYANVILPDFQEIGMAFKVDKQLDGGTRTFMDVLQKQF